MQNVTKKKLLVIGFLLLIGLVYIILKSYRAIKVDSLSTIESTSKEYYNLFNPIYLSKLKVNVTLESKTRHPITNFIYDDKYSLVLTKINVTKVLFLSECTNLYKSNSIQLGSEVYNVNDRFYYQFNYKSGKTIPVQDIYIEYDGDSISYLIKNDSIVSLCLSARKYLIKYEKNASADYLLDAKNNKMKNVPLSLLFFNRNRQLYMVVLCPMGKIKDIDKNIINKLFLY